MRATVALVTALLNLAVPVSASAQITTTYQAPTGSVSPALLITMHLSDGGSATLNPVVGPNCCLGMTCGFPAGYVGTDMSYTLPFAGPLTVTLTSGQDLVSSGTIATCVSHGAVLVCR